MNASNRSFKWCKRWEKLSNSCFVSNIFQRIKYCYCYILFSMYKSTRKNTFLTEKFNQLGNLLNPHSSSGLFMLWMISSASWMLMKSYLTSGTTLIWLIKNSERSLTLRWLPPKVNQSNWFYIWTKRLCTDIINS